VGDPPHPEHRSIPQFPGSALNFVQEVGELAETEGHHPDISFGCGYPTVSLSTENIKGLACERLHHGEWLLDRHDRSLDFKQ
jgi:4a-hydroxytetrahydrobiopterin dehydratase